MAPRKQVKQMKAVRHTRRTSTLRVHHTGAKIFPKDLSKYSKIGWQYTCAHSRAHLTRMRDACCTSFRMRIIVLHRALPVRQIRLAFPHLGGAHNLGDGKGPRQNHGPVGLAEGAEHNGGNTIAEGPAPVTACQTGVLACTRSSFSFRTSNEVVNVATRRMPGRHACVWPHQ